MQGIQKIDIKFELMKHELIKTEPIKHHLNPRKKKFNETPIDT